MGVIRSNIFRVRVNFAPPTWTNTPSGTYNENTTGNTLDNLTDSVSGFNITFTLGTSIPSQLENVSISGDTVTFDTGDVVGNRTVDLPIIASNSGGSATVQAQITITDTHALRGWLLSNKVWYLGGKVWGLFGNKS